MAQQDAGPPSETVQSRGNSKQEDIDQIRDKLC